MINVKMTLAPEDESISFDDIISFTTPTFIGLFDYGKNEYLLIPRSDRQFESTYIGSPGNLGELDDAVYESTGEHIDKVSTSSDYVLKLEDEQEDGV